MEELSTGNYNEDITRFLQKCYEKNVEILGEYFINYTIFSDNGDAPDISKFYITRGKHLSRLCLRIEDWIEESGGWI